MTFRAAPPYKQLPITKFLGSYTEADPRNLPMGSSPLNYDVDFLIASVVMRPGRTSAVAFNVSSLTGYAGAASAGTDWNSVANAIGSPDGNFASVAVSSSGSQNSQPTKFVDFRYPAPPPPPGGSGGGGSGGGCSSSGTWSNLSSIVSPTADASVAVCPNNSSMQANLYTFAFTIPSNATITGIQVGFKASASLTPASIAGILGSFDGTNFTPIAGVWEQVSIPSSILSALNLGGSTDTWLGTWLPSDFNSGSFCVALVGQVGSASGLDTIAVNNLSVTVYYSLPPQSSPLILTEYAFTIPAGVSVTGVTAVVTGKETGGAVTQAQLYANGKAVGNPKTVGFTSTSSPITLGSASDLWSVANLSVLAGEPTFGIAFTGMDGGSVFVDACQLVISLSPPSAPFFGYLKSSHLLGGLVETLALDSNGTLWQENINSSPGVMNSFYENIQPNSLAQSETIDQHEFICFSDGQNPTDQPRQWDGTNLDRISQVGPGSGPTITVNSSQYPIAASPLGLTQAFAKQAIWRVAWGANLDPGPGTPGTILTIYGPPSGPASFLAGLNVGDIVYLSGIPDMGTNLPSGSGQNPNGTYVVQSMGIWNGSGGTPLYYFCVTAPSSQGVLGPTALSGAYYQKTASIVSLLNPIPSGDAEVGGQLSISGASPSGWNATWPIIGSPSQGQLTISSTSLTSDVAVYTYALVSGAPPGWQPVEVVVLGQQLVDSNGNLWQVTTAGTTGSSVPPFTTSPQSDNTVVWTKVTGNMLITTLNLTNGGGIFNVQNAVILWATQTEFAVGITSPNITAAAEQGVAISGQGTAWLIDPGQTTLGTGNPGTDPIFAAGGGGVAVVAGQVAAGQRFAIEMFLTRNGLMTPASPPVAFFTSEGTNSIKFSNLCIGPSDVIARVIGITAAMSQNASIEGIGGPYYWIPEDVPVPNLTSGGSTTYNKTIINDNVSGATGNINLSDAVLINDNNSITIQGNNVLQQRELGSCIKVVEYAGRAFYLGEFTNETGFVNLSFDGGYLNSNPNVPAGWQLDSGLIPYLTLNVSSVFGQSLYINNLSSHGHHGTINSPGFPGTFPVFSTLWQPAYEDVFLSPIIQPNTAYSARVTCRIPSGGTSGSLVVALISPSLGAQGTWAYTIPFSSLTPQFTINVGAFGNPLWQSVPTDLRLSIYPLNMTNADIEIERIDVFPTEEPIYTTQLAASYVENYEAIDGVTGKIDTSAFTSQPQTNAFEWLDTLYIATTGRTFQTRDNATTEPAGWELRDTSDSVGCFGPFAADLGEQYALIADQNGLWLFDGGNHVKISQEVQQWWSLINKAAGKTVWVKNDIYQRRILVGVPMATPNQWLPNAPANPAPTTPNVILMCSYLGLDTPQELASGISIRSSMFTGHLLARDLERKWTIWQIAAPTGAFIDRPDGTRQFWLGGTVGEGRISYLNPSATDDNGNVIAETYVPYCFSDAEFEQALGVGSVRKLYPFASALLEGAGKFVNTIYPETLNRTAVATYPPRALATPALKNTIIPLNMTGNRMFVMFATDGALGSHFELKGFVLAVTTDPMIPVEAQ
jgi:hypothetical protein